MFLDLTMAGMFQGYSWAALQPWQDMLSFSQPFWITRIFAGLLMFAGFLCFLYNIFMTVTGAGQHATEATVAPA